MSDSAPTRYGAAGAWGGCGERFPVDQSNDGRCARDIRDDRARRRGGGVVAGGRRVARLAAPAAGGARGAVAGQRPPAARAREHVRADDGARDGETVAAGRGGGGEMRVGVRLLRGAEHRVSGSPRARHRGVPQLRALRSARPDPRDHAVEFPLLASLPLRGAGPHRGQRRDPEARAQRAALRAGTGGVVPGRRVPRRRVSVALHRARRRRPRDRG